MKARLPPRVCFVAVTLLLTGLAGGAAAVAQTLKGGAQQNGSAPIGGDVFASQYPDLGPPSTDAYDVNLCQRDRATFAHNDPWARTPGWGPAEIVSVEAMVHAPQGYYARCAVNTCYKDSAVCWRNLGYQTPEQVYRAERAKALQSAPPPPDCRKGPPGAYDPSQNPRCENYAPHARTPQSPPKAVLKICSAAQLAQIDFERYDNGLPISIAQVANAGGGRNYVIFLAGTEFKANQSNSVATDFSEAADIASRYDIAVMDAIISAIPAGSDVMFVGHSLGGMVAQNLTRRFAKTGFFNGKLTVTRVVTFGSPKTGSDVPGVTYHRFVVFGDPVPSLSSPLNGPAAGVTVIDGGPGVLPVPMVGEHIAYPQSQALRAYDALGDLLGGNCLELRQQPWTYPAAAH